MDINNLSSYMMLEPSQLIRAQRFVEHGLGMFDRDEELIESYLKEHLAGGTLDYAMHLLGESTTSYMGVQIHNQGGSFSAPTAGVYNVKSRPELKSKVKEKILKRNERENKAEKLKTKKEEVENVEELYKGKHGQSEKQYADSRSQGGKMVSGDSKMSGAEYSHGRRVKAANPGMQPDVGGKTKPKSQGKMDKGTRADLEYRKANLKKEELEATGLFSEKEIAAILESDNQVDEAMSSYDRNRKRAAQRAADRNAARAAGKTGVVPGVGYVSPRKERETYVDSAGTTRHKSGAKMPKD